MQLSDLVYLLFSDTYLAQEHKKLPSVSSLRAQQRISPEADKLGVSPNEGTVENVNGAYVFGTGLQNEVGEYNCFLNVIIQAISYFPSHDFYQCSFVSLFHLWCFLWPEMLFFPFPFGMNSVLMAFKTISR